MVVEAGMRRQEEEMGRMAGLLGRPSHMTSGGQYARGDI